jgi:hypothetical protein
MGQMHQKIVQSYDAKSTQDDRKNKESINIDLNDIIPPDPEVVDEAIKEQNVEKVTRKTEVFENFEIVN